MSERCGVCLDELRIDRSDDDLGIWRHSDGMLWSLNVRPHVARPGYPVPKWASRQDSEGWTTALWTAGVLAGVLYGVVVDRWLDDLAVYEAIYAAGDRGLSADELAERFEVNKWAMLDVCNKLRRDGTVKTAPRHGTSTIVFVRREPDPPWMQRRHGNTEPLI